MLKKEKTILVTGGAGYIGSHFVNQLLRQDVKIVIVDNFSQTRKNIIKNGKVEYFECDLRDKSKLSDIFKKYMFDLVVHFAALASVPESIIKPHEYYENNLLGGLNLLECMRSTGVSKIIFSSSASVYGEPQMEEIKENHPKNPTNPYGYSKLVFEQILKDYSRAYGFNSISLRYFCAAGCDESLSVGEYHNPETHVIPCILKTLLGAREKFFVFGNDFPTPDGTGVRDYIHVNDLAGAHLKAMEKLFENGEICEQYNLGINKGFSVMELIKAAEEISEKKLNFEVKPRRHGDPSRLIANSSKAQAELGWKPQYLEIKDIILSAYNFFKTTQI